MIKKLFLFLVVFALPFQVMGEAYSSPLGEKRAMFRHEEKDNLKEFSSSFDEAKMPKLDPNRLLRVGMLLPLTGHAAHLGEALKNAAMLAQFEVGEDNFILQLYDTKSNPDGAILAFDDAAFQGVDLIIGPLFSAEVKAIAPLAEEKGIKLISFTSDSSALGSGVYSIALLVPQQIERIVSYACERGSKKFALVTRDDNYGKTIADALGIAVGACDGAEITGEGYYDTKINNITEVVKLIIGRKAFLIEEERTRLRQKKAPDPLVISKDGGEIRITVDDLEISSKDVDPDFDTLLIADEGNRLRSVGALLSYYDVTTDNAMIIGTSLWNDRNIGREPSLRGGIYPALEEDGFNDFSLRYKNVYGNLPPRIAGQAYDATALVLTLADGYEDGLVTDEMLSSQAGFLGVDGIFRFHNNGYCERSLAVFEVGKTKPKKIVPASEIFDDESVFKSFDFEASSLEELEDTDWTKQPYLPLEQ